MRKGALALAAVLTVHGPAAAQTIDDRIKEAREAREAVQATADLAAADLGTLMRRYVTVQARADRAAARLIDAFLQESSIEAQVAQARSLLENRADAIYRAGPAAFMDVMLGASSPGDFLVRQELIEHALSADVDKAAEALELEARIRDIRRRVERHRQELVDRQSELTEIRAVMEIRLAEAEEAARQAGTRVQALLDQRQALARAAVAEQRFAALVAVDGELGELLELLGPEGGRGCQIPPDLEPTGQSFIGESSFYGEEFAGNPTAIGHIFNPELFTAAHRTLPLPSFLFVRYGDRCVTVLVNDRGPYVEGRVLDLSEGAARYLGLPGVGIVHAEVLQPR